MQTVTVIGAGLAGVEACHQLVKRNIPVRLYEMRPKVKSPAHHTDLFAELVCSNSLRADGIENAVGVLKKEMEAFDSLVIKMARAHAVPAGGSLSVDRIGFSQAITDYIKNHPLIEVINEEMTTIPEGPVIVASGPLTSDALSKAIMELLGKDYFYFFDAAAPIVTKESIDFSKAYYKSRYDKGDTALQVTSRQMLRRFHLGLFLHLFQDPALPADIALGHTFQIGLRVGNDLVMEQIVQALDLAELEE